MRACRCDEKQGIGCISGEIERFVVGGHGVAGAGGADSALPAALPSYRNCSDALHLACCLDLPTKFFECS